MKTNLCVWFLFATMSGGLVCAQADKPWSAMGTRERVEVYMSHIAGQRMAHCSIRYGAPEWTAEQDQVLRNSKGRLPFGGGSWAKLETNVPMTIGDREIAPGLYCLALEHGEDGSWSLILYEDRMVREQNLTPWPSRPVDAKGTTHPLERELVKGKSGTFAVSLVRGEEDSRATLRMHWGNQLLSAPVVWDLPGAPWAPLGKKGH